MVADYGYGDAYLRAWPGSACVRPRRRPAAYLAAISGGQIVIISPAGTWIDDFDFAGGTFTVGPNTYTGGPAGLMSLLGNEEIEIIILPTPMTTAEQAKMVAYAQGLGSAGLITIGGELVTNGDFSAGTTGWTTAGSGSPSLTVTSGVATLSNGADGSFVADNLMALDPAKNYLISVTELSEVVTGGAPAISFAAPTSIVKTLTAGMNRAIGSPVSGNDRLRIGVLATASAGGLFEFDNVSVREVIMP